MIDTLAALAKRCARLQPLAYMVAALCVCWFVIALLSGDSDMQDDSLVPCIVGFLWALMTILLSSLFSQVPDTPDDTTSRYARLKIRLQRLFFQLASIVFIFFTGAVLVTSYRLLNIWLSTFGT